MNDLTQTKFTELPCKELMGLRVNISSPDRGSIIFTHAQQFKPVIEDLLSKKGFKKLFSHFDNNPIYKLKNLDRDPPICIMFTFENRDYIQWTIGEYDYNFLKSYWVKNHIKKPIAKGEFDLKAINKCSEPLLVILDNMLGKAVEFLKEEK